MIAIGLSVALGAVLLMASGIVQNVMTTLGDTIYGGVNGQPTRLAGNTTTVQKFWSQTGNGSTSAAPSWQTIPTLGSLTYYLTNTASSIATYLAMTVAPFSPKTTLAFTGLVAGTDTVQNFATIAGVPNLTFIPAGIYVFHVHASRTGAAGTVKIQAQFWEVSSVGVDIALIGTSEASENLTTSEVEFSLAFADGNVYTPASAASRIVARVQAVVTGASGPTMNVFVGGTADSHVSLPSATVDASNFVPYTGATQDVNLGSHNLTVSSCTGCGGALHSVTFVIDGGGSAITTGDIKLYQTVDYACTINRVDISADQAGSITVDVWKANAAIPTSGNKISASAPLTLSSAQLSQSGSLTGWTTAVAVNDVFGFDVITAATVTRVSGQIWCQ